MTLLSMYGQGRSVSKGLRSPAGKYSTPYRCRDFSQSPVTSAIMLAWLRHKERVACLLLF